MRNFQITEFRSTNGIVTYTVNQRTGNYDLTTGNSNTYPLTRGRYDFVQPTRNSNYSTFKVFGIRRTSDGVVFKIGEKIVLLERTLNIVDIEFELNIPYLILNNLNGTTPVDDNLKKVSVALAVKYVPLVATTNDVRNTPLVANTASTTTKTFNNLGDIERELETQRTSNPIRVKAVLKKRSETLPQFLIKFFNRFNIENDTIFVSNDTIQTEKNKRRSLGDIYSICKYYYPTCTLMDLIELLYDQESELFEGLGRMRTNYCKIIKKRVWYLGKDTQESEVLNIDSVDEYGKNWNWYNNQIG